MSAIDDGCATAHREASESTVATTGQGTEMRLDIGNQFGEEIVLEAPVRSVEIHHIDLVGLGADDNHLGSC